MNNDDDDDDNELSNQPLLRFTSRYTGGDGGDDLLSRSL
eukprot:CAMPEP_0197598044 /NCGR_PEP_ID=MMETSP1326-20131121/28529_1 /TAXON_ID=1155430 /ORGANISM="Genus nov. species nov., Strain RCC2288" /LENGTH=38 /DNA_ID= /DNA_START= /DNA_END= /DNA_ORIENTATION=